APGEPARRDAPVVAEEAGDAHAVDSTGERLRPEDEQVGEAGAGEEVSKAFGEAHPGDARPRDHAYAGEVAAGPRAEEDAGQVVAGFLAVADADNTPANLDGTLAEQTRPGGVGVGVAVEDDIAVAVGVGVEGGVGDQVHGGVAAIPEGLGVEPGL